MDHKLYCFDVWILIPPHKGFYLHFSQHFLHFTMEIGRIISGRHWMHILHVIWCVFRANMHGIIGQNKLGASYGIWITFCGNGHICVNLLLVHPILQFKQGAEVGKVWKVELKLLKRENGMNKENIYP